MSTPPTIRCTVTARVGTDRAALVVRLPDGAGPAWAPGTQVLLTLLLPDVDQSGSVSRVDPSGLAGGADPSGAVVELPDAAIDSGPVSVGAVRDAAAAMLRWCDDPTASPTVLGSILAPLVPAVRAEAVADERVAVVAELEAAGHLAAANLIAVCGGPTFDERIAEAVADERQATYERRPDAAQGAMNEERRLQLVQFVVNNFASVGVAGSVPVATPEVHDAETAWIPLDELGDWTELAEAFDARVETSGDPSGEYTSVLCWPDGRRAYARDRLAIISYDAELPSPAEQLAAAGMGPVATPTEPKPGSDEAYRLQARLQAENRLVATLHGRSDPCRCPACAASPVPAEQPPDVIEVTRLGYSAGQEAEHG